MPPARIAASKELTMKSIVLHTARSDNGGTRRTAGEEVTVGDKPDQITLARATDLVHRHLGSGRGYAKPKAPRVKSVRKAPANPAPSSAPASAGAAPDAATDQQ
jgi:hypothetical protein